MTETVKTFKMAKEEILQDFLKGHEGEELMEVAEAEAEMDHALERARRAAFFEAVELVRAVAYKGAPPAESSVETWLNHHAHNDAISDALIALTKRFYE